MIKAARMKLSADIQRFLEVLDEYSNNGIRKRNDVGIIFEICAARSNAELLNKLIFTSKSVWNLNKTLKNASADDNSNKSVKTEFSKSLEQMKIYLVQIVEDTGESEIIQRFDDIYFQFTSGCVKNLIDLAHDFAIIKDLQNRGR